MGRMPNELREIIAWNIRDCRRKRFPRRGGSKQCAEEFSLFVDGNISPQQWSPWETGKRTPDESRLDQIARFFEKTVEYMRRDNRQGRIPGAPPTGFCLPDAVASLPDLRAGPSPNAGDERMDGANGEPPPNAPPGSAASFFWLADRVVDHILRNGIKVRVERDVGPHSRGGGDGDCF